MHFNQEKYMYNPGENIKLWDKIGLSKQEHEKIALDFERQTIKNHENVRKTACSIEQEFGERGVDFEGIIFAQLSKEFNPEDVDFNNEIEKSMRNIVSTSYSQYIVDGVYPRTHLIELKKNEGGGYRINFDINYEYRDAHQLFLFIASKIPDFYRKLEKARIERKPLELARDIEEQFGLGMYRKITTAQVADARKLLFKLGKF